MQTSTPTVFYFQFYHTHHFRNFILTFVKDCFREMRSFYHTHLPFPLRTLHSPCSASSVQPSVAPPLFGPSSELWLSPPGPASIPLKRAQHSFLKKTWTSDQQPGQRNSFLLQSGPRSGYNSQVINPSVQTKHPFFGCLINCFNFTLVSYSPKVD